MYLNINKYGIVLDLDSPSGQAEMHRLLERVHHRGIARGQFADTERRRRALPVAIVDERGRERQRNRRHLRESGAGRRRAGDDRDQ